MPKQEKESQREGEERKDELIDMLEERGYSESESFEDGKEGREKMQEYLRALDAQNKVYHTVVSKGEKGMIWRVLERDKKEGEE